jgi:alcohol dehydrogenase class IV
MDYNLDYATPKYAQIAGFLGLDTRGMDEQTAARRAAAHVRNLVTEVGMPLHLSTFGVKKEDLALIAQESMPSGSLKHNARPLAEKDVVAILQAAL